MQRIQFTQISVVCLFYFKHLTKTEQCSYNPLQQHKLKSVVDTTTLNTTAIQRHIQNPVKHLRQSRTQSNTQNGASFKKNYCFILDVSLGSKHTSVIRYLSTTCRYCCVAELVCTQALRGCLLFEKKKNFVFQKLRGFLHSFQQQPPCSNL